MAGNTSVAAILLILAGVQAQHSVTLSSESLCAVTGSTVKISCKYTTSDSSRVRQREWYQLQSSDGQERVLSKDPQYSARVSVRTGPNDCDLTVMDVRQRDSGVYNFRFRTSSGDWISAPSGVNLTVTDLQVKVNHKTAGQRTVKVTCSSTCSLSENLHYYWYRNANMKYDFSTEHDSTNLYKEGSYSCQVSRSSHRSPPVCILGKQCWGVTHTPEHVCALKGSSVDLSCSYKHPAEHTVTELVWFVKKQVDAEPVNVREDEEYQGRVQYRQSSQNDCSMRINQLRERDAQTYRFRFHTDGGEYTGQQGVTLSVTDLHVSVSDQYSGKKLYCTGTCTLPNNLNYIWYKNGRRLTMSSSQPFMYVTAEQAGSYSCAVRGHEELPSRAVCVHDWNCWSVSYFTQTICALIGSSVDIRSYYTFPDHVRDPQPAWYIRNLRQEKELSPADGRVEFFRDRVNMYTLRLKHLTESESAEYLLRFKVHWYGTHSSTGVFLSVTGLEVKVEPVAVTLSEEQTVTLMCSTTCTLPNNPTYIWYKNRQPVLHCKSASCSVAVVSGGVSYSCVVEGYESLPSPPVYSPRNTSAVMVSSGERMEGDSVTLSCSSEANPPVLIYSWFKQRAAEDAPLTIGQNYIITNISSQHSGLYYCTAHNQLGQHSSTPTRLDVLYFPRNTRAVLVSSGERMEGDSVTLSCSSDANPPVLIYSWFKQRAAEDAPLTTGQNYTITNISSQHSGLYYCTAQNQLGQHSSTPTRLNVLYPPRQPSVSEHVSASSITLVCVSDSNPVSSYFWYKKTGSDIQLIGNSTNLTLATGAHGSLYCMAMNQCGSYNSTVLSFIPDNASAKYAASSVTAILILTFIAAFLWMRRRAAAASKRSEEKSGRDECAPVYDNVSAMPMTSAPTRTAASEDEDELNYATVHFTRSPPLYSTVQLPNALRQDKDVEYATVTLSKPRALRNPIYGTVKRT
ncbi:hypothetical protein AOLI_G00288820 [Acnodon oligacanthus]